MVAFFLGKWDFNKCWGND